MEKKDNSNINEKTKMSSRVIKLIRENRKLTPRSFAHKLKIEELYVVELENGDKPITKELLTQLNNNFVLTEGEILLLNMAYEIAYPKDVVTKEMIEYVIGSNILSIMGEYTEVDEAQKLLKEKIKEGKK